KITRAEAVAIINRMLGRVLAKNNVPQSLYHIYPDLTTSHWAFADMIEASVSHEYEWEDGTEIWIGWK
ncbi:MAG: hypothetical protein FWF85_05590, partial [Clostridiales bacterium]|nr:hypothetical protein [Clostridiales bacterium]